MLIFIAPVVFHYCLTRDRSKLQKRYQKANAISRNITFEIDILNLGILYWDPPPPDLVRYLAISNLTQNIS